MIFALLFSLPPSRNSDPGSHSRLFSPPTHYGSCLACFIARRFQLFLTSSTRVELCLPTLGALSSWSFFFFANKFKISPRRDSNSRINTSSIRGLPLVHRGDRLICTSFMYLLSLTSSSILFVLTRTSWRCIDFSNRRCQSKVTTVEINPGSSQMRPPYCSSGAYRVPRRWKLINVVN